MKEWLLSVTAVVLLTVLLELMVSEGKIKKYIQGILRLALVVTMIFPVIKFVKSDFNFDLKVDNGIEENIVDISFLERIHAARYAETEISLENDLKNAGISGAKVHINIYYNSSGAVEVDYVTVDATHAVISEQDANILFTDKIKTTVKKRLNVSEEKIIIYGVA